MLPGTLPFDGLQNYDYEILSFAISGGNLVFLRKVFTYICFIFLKNMNAFFHQFTLIIYRSMFWRVMFPEGHMWGAMILEAYISPVKFEHFTTPDNEEFKEVRRVWNSRLVGFLNFLFLWKDLRALKFLSIFHLKFSSIYFILMDSVVKADYKGHHIKTCVIYHLVFTLKNNDQNLHISVLKIKQTCRMHALLCIEFAVQKASANVK